MPGKTPHSLTHLGALEKELEKIRLLDVAAYANEEAEIGLRGIASPIRNDEGLIVAGLSISAPTDRNNPGWIAQIKDTTIAISDALGCRQQRTG